MTTNRHLRTIAAIACMLIALLLPATAMAWQATLSDAQTVAYAQADSDITTVEQDSTTYGTPTVIYPLSTANNTPAYSTTSTLSRYRTGTIYASDQCTILSSYSSGWLRVRYPVSGGTKIAYVPAGSFMVNPNYSKTRISIIGNTTVYRRSNLQQSFGTVYRSDTIYLVGESGNSLQIMYNISGGWKCGWISKLYRYTAPVTTPAPALPQYATISNGTYYLKTSYGYALDNAGGGMGLHTNMQIWGFAPGELNQQFKITAVGMGYYRITSCRSGLALDADTDSNPRNLQSWSYEGSNQQWRFRKNGSGYCIQNRVSGTYIDVKGGDFNNGTNVWCYDYNGNSSMTWYLVPVSSVATPTPTPVQQNQLVSSSEIAAVARDYGISTSSDYYKGLNRINNYYENFKNETKPVIFFFEGAGDSFNTTVRDGAMCVVVQNKHITYLSKHCTTLPDNPFSSKNNKGTTMPTVIDGIYSYSSTIHNSQYPALHVSSTNGGSVPVVRCIASNNYDPKGESSGINIHRRSKFTNSSPSASWGNSCGCLLVGKLDSEGSGGTAKSSEYDAFSKAVGFTSSGNTVNGAKYYKTDGFVVVDRALAENDGSLLKIYGNQALVNAIRGK